ncbi:MAG: SDR family oxidoreductase [Planctomycetes bacterium]|nr:SDR family oxidoreductase [Planctomycetota bacterium]
MQILVTGCAGFIGYHLSQRLLAEGHTVVGMDDFSSGQKINSDALRQQPRFRFVQHNVAEPLTITDHFDQIYNMACPASPADFDRRRLHILATCSRGPWNLAELALRCDARLFHASTSEVYGDPLVNPQIESYWGNVSCNGPRSCYDEGKRFAEALLAAYRREYGLKTRIARIFNTYGPRMRADDGRALPNFINQALTGQPLTVHGQGQQTRSFCYVDDLVDGIIRLTNSAVDEPVNLGNPVEITVLEIAEEIIRLCNSSSTVIHVPRPQDDPNIRRPDITRAQTLLGWDPTVERSVGLARVVEWFREHPPR